MYTSSVVNMEEQQDAPVAHVQSSSKDPRAQDIGDDYDIPPPEPSTSFAALKDRIKDHYEVASDYYYSLWYVPTKHTRPQVSGLEAFAKYQG